MTKYLPYATAAGWLAAVTLGWLWLQARDDVAEQQERCNREKIEAVAAASEVARQAAERASEAREGQLRAMLIEAENAREIAAEAARIASEAPARVRTVIKEVSNENTCLDLPVPAAVLDSLRGCESGGETRPGRNRPLRAGECAR